MLCPISVSALVGANEEVVCMTSSSSDGDVVDTYGNMSAPRTLIGVAPSCKQNLCAAWCQPVGRLGGWGLLINMLLFWWCAQDASGGVILGVACSMP